MASRIIAEAWFTGMLSCGVIITHDPVNKSEPYKARIGAIAGVQKETDRISLRDYGQRLDIRCARDLVLRHGRWLESEQSIDLELHLLSESNKPANLGLEKEDNDG